MMGRNGPPPQGYVHPPVSPPPPPRVGVGVDLQFTPVSEQLRRLYSALGIEIPETPVVTLAPHPVVPQQPGIRHLFSALTEVIQRVSRSRVAAVPPVPTPPASAGLPPTTPVPDQHRVIQLRRPKAE